MRDYAATLQLIKQVNDQAKIALAKAEPVIAARLSDKASMIAHQQKTGETKRAVFTIA